MREHKSIRTHLWTNPGTYVFLDTIYITSWGLELFRNPCSTSTLVLKNTHNTVFLLTLGEKIWFTDLSSYPNTERIRTHGFWPCLHTLLPLLPMVDWIVLILQRTLIFLSQTYRKLCRTTVKIVFKFHNSLWWRHLNYRIWRNKFWQKITQFWEFRVGLHDSRVNKVYLRQSKKDREPRRETT